MQNYVSVPEKIQNWIILLSFLFSRCFNIKTVTKSQRAWKLCRLMFRNESKEEKKQQPVRKIPRLKESGLVVGEDEGRGRYPASVLPSFTVFDFRSKQRLPFEVRRLRSPPPSFAKRWSQLQISPSDLRTSQKASVTQEHTHKAYLYPCHSFLPKWLSPSEESQTLEGDQIQLGLCFSQRK